MRKVHVVMFGSQIIINIVFSLVLFNGLLGGNGIFAFVYPIFVFVYLLADMFLTELTTDLIAHVFKNRKACIASIVVRDLLIIIFWLCFLLYININVLTFWGTACYALPKILKIVICDLINQQKYFHKYIEI